MAAIKAYGVAQEGRDIAVPSVFVVSAAGKVVFRHVTDDFTERPTVAQVLEGVPAR